MTATEPQHAVLRNSLQHDDNDGEFVDIISFFCEPNRTMKEPMQQLLRKVVESYQDEFPAYMRAVFEWCIDKSDDICVHQLIFFWALCEEEFLLRLVRQCSARAPPAYQEKRELFLQYLKLTQQNFVTVFVHSDNCIPAMANFCATISDCWTMNRLQYMRTMIAQVDTYSSGSAAAEKILTMVDTSSSSTSSI